MDTIKTLLFGCIALAASLSAFPSYAGFTSGNELLDACSKTEQGGGYITARAVCLGYVTGVYDMIELHQTAKWSDGTKPHKVICLPSEVEAGQVKDVVVKYLNENPAERHMDAAALVWNALNAAFPCK